MKLELYQEVALSRDIPEHQLKQGDIATLVDFVPHPEGGETGCVLEVSNAIGDTVAVIIVGESCIEPLRADEVFTARPLMQAAAI
jgi:hypothetical protein